MQKRIKKRFDLDVTEANIIHSKTFELDKNITTINGLLMTGINVSPNERYYNVGGKAPGNGKLTLEYKDSDYAALVFEQYRVSIYLDCEISEEV